MALAICSACLVPALPAIAATPSTAALAPECQRALDRLQRCNREAEAAGIATPARRVRSARYQERLAAWWRNAGTTAAMRQSCAAIADDPEPCVDRAAIRPPSAEEEAEEAREFEDVMKRFDGMGVPKGGK